MGLLAPLFLLGVAAIALPLWLHRLQTQSSERLPFSSAMLLETADQQVHVKKKLKYLLLLAARIVLLVLLAIAFARPFLAQAPTAIVATEAGTRLVLIDTSVSMDRTGAFSQALAEARRAIDEAPAEALIQVAGADAALNIAGSLTNDKAAARAAAAALAPSALRLDYGEVMSALERLTDGLPPPVSVHFVSDFQASGMPPRFSDVIPDGVSGLVPHVVGTGQPFNWSIDYLRASGNSIDVGVTGFGDRERVGDVELRINGVVVDGRGLSTTGTQSLHFDMPALEEGENRLEFRIIADDDFAADNGWFHVIDNSPPAAIPLITINPDGLPFTYLSAALESAGRYRVEAMLLSEFDPRVLSRYRWAIIDDIGLVDPRLASALTAFIEGGGNLLAFAGDRATTLEAIPVSGHLPAASSVRPQAGGFLSIGRIDDRHPVLSETDGWQNVTVSRNLALDEQVDDEVLIRLSNNEPFLIERRLGNGRLLLVTAPLDNTWNDLPARPVFVSFMVESAGYLSGASDVARTYTAGATLPLGIVGSSSGQVVDPDGDTVLSLADTAREQQINLDRTGFYEVYTPQGQTTVAVNIDPRESDLRKISQEVLDSWQASTVASPVDGGAGFSTEETETVPLWHWALLILALIVIGESILGNMYLAPRRTERA